MVDKNWKGPKAGPDPEYNRWDLGGYSVIDYFSEPRDSLIRFRVYSEFDSNYQRLLLEEFPTLSEAQDYVQAQLVKGPSKTA